MYQPGNMAMGKGRDCNKLYLIDYESAKKFRDDQTGQHIAYREEGTFWPIFPGSGTPIQSLSILLTVTRFYYFE